MNFQYFPKVGAVHLCFTISTFFVVFFGYRRFIDYENSIYTEKKLSFYKLSNLNSPLGIHFTYIQKDKNGDTIPESSRTNHSILIGNTEFRFIVAMSRVQHAGLKKGEKELKMLSEEVSYDTILLVKDHSNSTEFRVQNPMDTNMAVEKKEPDNKKGAPVVTLCKSIPDPERINLLAEGKKGFVTQLSPPYYSDDHSIEIILEKQQEFANEFYVNEALERKLDARIRFFNYTNKNNGTLGIWEFHYYSPGKDTTEQLYKIIDRISNLGELN